MSALEPVKCPTCRGIQQVELGAAGYTCALCGSEWQWAICEACDCLELALAGQESWRCQKCARYTRSWWRSSSPGPDAAAIRQRRHHEAVVRHARRAAPGRRKRRVIAGAGAGMAVVGLAVALLASLTGGVTAEGETRAACAQFSDVRSAVANGSVDRAELARSLASIRERAANGAAPVAVAAKRLEAAAQPGTSAFLVAQAQLDRACRTSTEA